MFGGLHIVFNSAGILRDRMFHNMSPEDWQAVIDVHLTGHFNINRAPINLFREQGYGRLILVSSTSGLLGNVGQRPLETEDAILALEVGAALTVDLL